MRDLTEEIAKCGEKQVFEGKKSPLNLHFFIMNNISNKLSKNEIKRIKHLRNIGVSIQKIADQFKVGTATVSYHTNYNYRRYILTYPRKKYGLKKIMKTKLTEEQINEIKKLKEEGMGYSVLGRKFKVSDNTIRYYTNPQYKDFMQNKNKNPSERRLFEKKLNVENIEKAKKFREEGLSYSKIGKILGVSGCAILYHLSPKYKKKALTRLRVYRKHKEEEEVNADKINKLLNKYDYAQEDLEVLYSFLENKINICKGCKKDFIGDEKFHNDECRKNFNSKMFRIFLK